MSSWETVKLKEVVKIISGYAFKAKDFKENNGVPVIKIGNINYYDVDIYKNISYVDECFLNTIDEKFIIKRDDILISLTGSHINQPNSMVGRVGKYREEKLSLLNQRAGKIMPNKNVCKEFIYHLFSLKSMTYLIATIAYGGANQVNISPKTIEKLKIKIPDLKTQEKIADILSTYDELIENNNRRIEILEKTAEEIYKEWFVRMRFPGYENTKFEKGIPEGWEVRKIGELVKRLQAGHFYKENELESIGEVIVIDQSEKEYMGYHNGAPTHKASIEEPIILFGDHSCKMLIMIRPFSLAENVVPFISNTKSPELFLYYCFRKLIHTEEYRRHWRELINKKVFYPPIVLQNKFKNTIEDNIIMIEEYRRQNQNLAQQRDLLLPRLMNGTIQVK